MPASSIKKLVRTAALCTGLLAGSTQLESASDTRTIYYIDPTHSSIEFTVPFMGIARVSGRFDQFYGTVVHDAEDLAASSVEVVIRAASIDTRNERRDADLRSDSYFDVERFAALTFRSRRMTERDGAQVMIGDLTIRDVTREVELPFSILGVLEGAQGREMGAEATISFDRREFGISQGQFSGDQSFIGNEVSIRLLMRLREPTVEKKRLAADRPAVTIEADQLESYLGRYREETEGWELSVHRLAGELALERGGTLLRILPLGDGRFRLQDFAAIIRFETGGDGAALVFERPGREPQKYLEVMEAG